MRSLGLFLLRLTFGSLIALHGFPKLFGGPGKKVSADAERVLGAGFNQSMERGGLQNVVGMMQGMEVPAPQTLAAVHAGTEFFGGLALILGWHTRLAALALTVSQVVAVQKVHLQAGLINSAPNTGYEFNASLAAATAALTITGPGAIALD